MDKRLFLDVDKKVWVIGETKIPVIENVPMEDLQWFRDKSKEIEELRESNKLTIKIGLDIDEEWWEKTCQLGLGKSKSEILKLKISEPKFRALMAEVLHFLQNFGTLEEAKQSGIYGQEIQTSEAKP